MNDYERNEWRNIKRDVDRVSFSTTEGVLIETTLDYIQSDSPIPIDTPRFNEGQ